MINPRYATRQAGEIAADHILPGHHGGANGSLASKERSSREIFHTALPPRGRAAFPVTEPEEHSFRCSE
jgi:hypothetical protein